MLYSVESLLTCGPAPFSVLKLFIRIAWVYGGGAGVTPGIAVCGACLSCSAADILDNGKNSVTNQPTEKIVKSHKIKIKVMKKKKK